eukprot:TRINITY_DN33941_c0_g1_i1.p1 TRINITY_DN33941_c0_g1~~TRINITY_DN33941_c0_g1_i1.p1  ORF type:complete len:485 (+),score=29.57 TRINITY_DN33941_c0_g1_i1:74-1528(+)
MVGYYNLMPPKCSSRSESRGVRRNEQNGVDECDVSILTMFFMTLGFCAAQVAWGVQNSIATPTFRELGVSTSNTALVWLAGPVSGIIAQPMVGAWSDRCTSFLGRRRPFILGSSVLICASMLLFGYARQCGELLGDSESARPVAIATAIFAFWVMDFSVNALQGPMRALASDIFSVSQQAVVGGVFALHTGLGSCVSYGLGSLQLVNIFGGMFVSQVRALTVLSVTCIIAMVACTLCLAKEQRSHQTTHDGDDLNVRSGRYCHRYTGLRDTFKQFPLLMRCVFIVQFLTSIGKNGSLMFVTDWFGEVVYGGDPQAPHDSEAYKSFEVGIRMGNLAMLCCGIISGAFGLLLPYLLMLCRKQLLWVGSLSVGAIVLMTMGFVNQPVSFAFTSVALMGVALGARESIPWSVITSLSKGTEDAGSNTSLFNLSQAIPGLISSLVGSVVGQLFGLSAILGACAVPLGSAALLVVILIPGNLESVEVSEV